MYQDWTSRTARTLFGKFYEIVILAYRRKAEFTEYVLESGALIMDTRNIECVLRNIVLMYYDIEQFAMVTLVTR